MLAGIITFAVIRLRRSIPGAPFEIGFWVGSGNTPNRVAQGFGAVPLITLASAANDDALLNPPSDDSEREKDEESVDDSDALRGFHPVARVGG